MASAVVIVGSIFYQIYNDFVCSNDKYENLRAYLITFLFFYSMFNSWFYDEPKKIFGALLIFAFLVNKWDKLIIKIIKKTLK